MIIKKMTRPGFWLLVSILLNNSVVQAEDDAGVVESLTGFNVNKGTFLEDAGIRVDGWFEFGIGGNPRANRQNGNNTPVTFNDQTNEVTGNELYTYIERAVNTEGDSWDIGFRADLLYGTDARFTKTSNFDSRWLSNGEYTLSMPQWYAEVFAPVGNGLTTKVGHFYTIIGYEVVTAPDNFFFSHAYTMQYGEPFTHSGFLSTYTVNDNISISAGVVSGWDALFDTPANFLGGASYTTDDGNTSLYVSLITGDATNANKHNRTMYSVVLTHDFLENFHYVLQHDFGIEQRINATGGAARWYGINQYLTYDITDTLGAGMRFEWFRDEHGVRVGFGSNSYYAITGGVNWTPLSWLKLRPEIRYDWATAGNAYDGGRLGDQLLLSMDAIIQF